MYPNSKIKWIFFPFFSVLRYFYICGYGPRVLFSLFNPPKNNRGRKIKESGCVGKYVIDIPREEKWNYVLTLNILFGKRDIKSQYSGLQYLGYWRQLTVSSLNDHKKSLLLVIMKIIWLNKNWVGFALVCALSGLLYLWNHFILQN